MSIRVRQADYPDLRAVHGLRTKVFEAEWERSPHAVKGVGWRSMAIAEHETYEWLLSNDTVVLLAEDGEEPVGFAVMATGHHMGLTSDLISVVIRTIWVEPEHRKEASARLLRELYRLASLLGADRVQFMARAENRDLVMQVEGNGYRPLAVVYEKELGYGRRRRERESKAGEAGHRASDGSAGGVEGEVPQRPALSRSVAASDGLDGGPPELEPGGGGGSGAERGCERPRRSQEPAC